MNTKKEQPGCSGEFRDRAITYGYDGFAGPESRTQPARSIQQSHGATVSLPAGTWSYGHDGMGRRTFKRAPGNVLTRYLHGAEGSLLAETSPGGTSLTSIYLDWDGRVEAIGGALSPQNLEYEWYAVDLIETITNHAYPSLSQVFYYDALSRLTDVPTPGAGRRTATVSPAAATGSTGSRPPAPGQEATRTTPAATAPPRPSPATRSSTSMTASPARRAAPSRR